MHQYYLMRHVRRQPVWRPLRDPIRRWLDLSTWRWCRRIPTDGWKQTPYAYSPRSRSRSYRKRASDNNCKRPKKKPKPNPKEPEWDGQCSDEESFERLKVRFLHELDVTYGLQYGIDLDAFVKQIDPIKQFKMMRQLSTTSIVGTRDEVMSELMSHRQKRALIAAAHLSNSLPRAMDASLSLEELTSRKFQPNELAQLTRTRSVYFSTMDDLPIVIDTGGSFSVTPNREDFEGDLRPADIDDLQGLAGPAVVAGVGTVKWMIKDVFGATRMIRTQSYYVPEAAI